MQTRHTALFGIIIASFTMATAARAEEKSDTSISYGFGTHFGEPYQGKDVTKNVVGITHWSPYKYGSNYIDAQVLMSDKHDPTGPNSTSGAQEINLKYRTNLDFGKVMGKPDAFSLGPVKSLGLTAGFDFRNKDDVYYNSRERQAVIGPSIGFKVPGYLNAGILAAWQSDAPYNKVTGIQSSRYDYDPHAMVAVNWGIPFNVGPVALSYEGQASYAAAKGKDAYGNATKPETNLDMRVMYDVGQWMGAGKDTLRLGVEYLYRHNYDGIDHKGSAGNSANTSTPLVRAEYHF